jgi:hypothetical protein
VIVRGCSTGVLLICRCGAAASLCITLSVRCGTFKLAAGAAARVELEN